jgi:putative membrane protein
MQTNYREQHPRRGGIFGWVILAVVIVAIVSFFAVVALRGYPTGPMMTYNGYPVFGWWFFFPFGFFFIFFILFFVGRFIFWPWGWGWRRRYWYGYGDAHEILRQRYARGEITKEQFDQMTRDLEQHQ